MAAPSFKGAVMKRRDFILGLGGAALCSLTARAQQTSVVVGVLEVGKEGSARTFLAPAWARLAEMRFVEGRNLTIESRGADFEQDRLTKLAEEFVQRRVAARRQISNEIRSHHFPDWF